MCVLSGVFLCEVCVQGIVCEVGGMCLCGLSSLCSVYGEWYICVRHLNWIVCLVSGGCLCEVCALCSVCVSPRFEYFSALAVLIKVLKN